MALATPPSATGRSSRFRVAPYAELRALLERYPQLHLYIDDAHATSWCGLSGRGAALAALGDHERVVVALSLNKAFAAAGGALFLPNATLAKRIRHTGGPMLFSGPIQPPMLGVAVASARLHLDPAFSALQAELAARIEHAHRVLDERGVPRATSDRTPILMIPCDAPNIALDTVRRLRERGFYVCPSVFPAVPVNQPGVRCTITRHNSLADIDAFADALAVAFREANEAEPARSASSARRAAITTHSTQ